MGSAAQPGRRMQAARSRPARPAAVVAAAALRAFYKGGLLRLHAPPAHVRTPGGMEQLGEALAQVKTELAGEPGDATRLDDATKPATSAATEPEPDEAVQLATVKTVKKALGNYIKFINAHPEVLVAHYADNAPGLKEARQALKQLRTAWQPLNPQTQPPQLGVALIRINAELHCKLNFQCLAVDGTAAPELVVELGALWSEYTWGCRALRLDTTVGATLAGVNSLPPGQGLAQLSGMAEEVDAKARREEAQATRIDDAREELLRQYDSGELSEDQLQDDAVAISTAGPAAVGDMIRRWALVEPYLGFLSLQRLMAAAQSGAWAWVEAASVLTGPLVIQAIVDCVAACAEDSPKEATQGYSLSSLRFYAMAGFGLLLSGVGLEGARYLTCSEPLLNFSREQCGFSPCFVET
jgi:hypothetical protein